MTPDEIDILLDHVDSASWADELPAELRSSGQELREVAEWLDLVDPAELTATEPPPDLADRIHAEIGPRPAVAARRLSPMWVGRWTPAVAAAVLLVVVLAASLWPRDDGFVEFELASQGGEALTAELKFEQVGDTTVFDVRVSGLSDLTYDVWVRTEGDLERHWLGRFDGDIEGTGTYTADFTIDEIERFWVTDPGDEPVLGHDID